MQRYRVQTLYPVVFTLLCLVAPLTLATSASAAPFPTPSTAISKQPTAVSEGFDCSTVNQLPQMECEALIALYNSTDGPEWLDSWPLTYPYPCNWYGVYCFSGHVRRLALYQNDLGGSIPAELANLVNLESLILSENYISGAIPIELTNLSNLQRLDLVENRLIGRIPSELANLSNLTYLDLGDNRLSGDIPAELGELSSLETLDLAWNDLSGNIPVELANLSNLKVLRLNDNALQGNIPVELARLSNLEVLTLGDNDLAGSIPVELANLSNLEILVLDGNHLEGSIPVEFGTLSSLKSLVLSENQLSGSIPTELGDLSNLEVLGLSGNQFYGGIPETFAKLSKLESFSYSNNQLSGVIPMWLSGLLSLEAINLSNNQLTGNIPLEFGGLNLYYLNLSNNQLSGEIPSTMTNLTRLHWFYFDYTRLCEPNQQSFRDWLASIPDVRRSGLICGVSQTYKISGRVLDGADQPVSGVHVEIATGGIVVAEPTTDASGNYTATDLMDNTYTVTPVKPSSIFTPSARTIPVPPDQYGVDFARLPETIWSAYRPEPDSFQFDNKSRRTNWDIFRATFGADNVERIVGGKVVLRPQAERYFHQQYKCDASWSTCSEVGMGGNCSGMAASSALFFANWATPATFLDDHAADKPFDLVVGDLVAGLWPENGISDFVVRYQGYQTGQQVRRAKIDAAGRSVAQDLAIIKAAIDGGLQAPIYVSIQSRTGQPDCVGHALIPYAYRDTGAVTLIYVYDPNHPGDEDAVLVLSPNLNAWRYDHRNSIGVWDSVDNTCGGDPLRAIPIEAWKDMPLPPWNGEDSRTQTGELTTNLVEVNASGGASLLILDVQGRRLGMSNGNLLEEIPGAMRDIPDVVQPGATSIIPQRYVFSTIDSAQPLTVQVTYVATSTVNVGQYSADGVFLFATEPGTGKVASVDTLVTDTLHLNTASGGISLVGGSDGVKSLTFINEVGSADREVSVSSHLSSGGALGVQTDSYLGSITIHPAAGETEYTLQSKQVGTDSLQFSATIDVDAPGEIHTVTFDWTQSDSAQLEVDQDGDGVTDQTETIKNEVDKPVYLPLIVR